jgi:hypothetical protein
MVDLAQETAPTAADIAEWFRIEKEMKRLKGIEAMLRSRLAAHFFPSPVEGSAENKHPLNDGTGAILQMTHTINRDVDPGALQALIEAQQKAHFGEDGTPLQSNEPKLPLGKLIKYEPKLVKAEYNKLTTEERQLMDTALIVKPGMPALEVKIPKRPA